MLMFLRTNDASAAAAFAVPATRHALARVPHDHLLLRVLGRALVLWDSIAPDRAWIADQMPALIRVRGSAQRSEGSSTAESREGCSAYSGSALSSPCFAARRLPGSV